MSADDGLLPLTTIKEELETDATVIIKEEPAEDEPAGPSKNIWVKDEMIIEERTTLPQQLPCQNTNSTIEGARREIRQKIDKDKPYSCYACAYRCLYKYSLITHIRTHTGEKPFVCDVCKCNFRTSSQLVTHKFKHTGERPYKCDVCPAKFRDITTLKNHVRTHTGEKPYACGVCSARFAQIGNLRCHEWTHKGEKKFVCEFCEAPFRTSSHLNRHRLRHTGEKPYKCDCCSTKFRDLRTLKNHMRVHTGEKPFACGVCDARFAQLSYLRTHEGVHKEEKKFVCDLCKTTFRTRSHLNRHKLRHTGETPYKCDACPSNFCDLRTLKTHVKVHTGETPYACGVCAARFIELTQLKQHERVHLGADQFACDVRGSRYGEADGLRKHKKTHTSLDVERNMEGGTPAVDALTKTGEFTIKKEPAVDELKCPSKLVSTKTDKSACSPEGTDNPSENYCEVQKKRHLCFACRYSSESLRDLKMHIRVHIGEKPYGCDLCEAKFRNGNLLRRHKSKTHKAPNSMDDQEICMDDVSGSVGDSHAHNDGDGTKTIVQAVEPSAKVSAADGLAGPFERVWIKTDETEETGVWIKFENSADSDDVKEENQTSPMFGVKK